MSHFDDPSPRTILKFCCLSSIEVNQFSIFFALIQFYTYTYTTVFYIYTYKEEYKS
jgi:hypothetical protein